VAEQRRPADRHDTHDRELLARAAAGDASASDAARAADLVATCLECAVLDTDLRALTTSLRDLGSGVWTAPAPMDFRLTPEVAARIRRRGFGRWLPALADPVGARLRARMATGLVAIGLVGILVSAGAPGFLAGAGGGTAESAAQGTAQGGPGAVPGSEKSVGTSLPALAPAPVPTVAGAVAMTDTPARDVAASDAAGSVAAAPEASSTDVSPLGSPAYEAATDGGPKSTVSLAASVLLAVSLLAIAAGLGILLLSRRGGRPGA